MKKLLIVLMIISVGMGSCSKEQRPLTKKQEQAIVKASVDSIMTARNKVIDSQAKVDLDHRIAIEVKVKADSILSAKAKIASGDTIKKADKAADKKGIVIPQKPMTPAQKRLLINKAH